MDKYRIHLRIDKQTGSQHAPAEHADIALGDFVFASMADVQARLDAVRQCFAVRPDPAAPPAAEAAHGAPGNAR